MNWKINSSITKQDKIMTGWIFVSDLDVFNSLGMVALERGWRQNEG